VSVKKRSRAPDLARHTSHCRVCRSPFLQEIEAQFIEWRPQAEIARTFKLGSRLAVWRHARAVGLIERRNSNTSVALANYIERCARVQPNATALVSACAQLARLDAEGRDVQRIENVSGLAGLFYRLSVDEATRYAETGVLPEWFRKEVLDTPRREAEVQRA
jgi:hypothetical protein